MGIAEAPDIYSYIVINVWRKKDDQPQRAMSGMYFVRKICVNRCKSVSKNRPEDTDFIDFTDYGLVSNPRFT